MSGPRNNDWPRIAVVGAGAVGCYFGGMLARAGAPVILIGRRARVDAISRHALLITDSTFEDRVRIEASTGMERARDAAVVLLSVKTLDTERAVAELAAYISRQTIVLSLQNGVDNVRRIFAASGLSAFPAVVYVSVEMTGPGHVTKSGEGHILVGVPRDREHSASDAKEALEKMVRLFGRAGVCCRVSDNIEGELWLKLLWNCAGNAVSALGRASYQQMAANALARETLRAAAEEVVEVAKAAGVALPDCDLSDKHIREIHNIGEVTSSTAQDVVRGKRTEIDSLNGYIVARAQQLGVRVPVNRTLYSLVKLLEDGFGVPRSQPATKQVRERKP